MLISLHHDGTAYLGTFLAPHFSIYLFVHSHSATQESFNKPVLARVGQQQNGSKIPNLSNTAMVKFSQIYGAPLLNVRHQS